MVHNKNFKLAPLRLSAAALAVALLVSGCGGGGATAEVSTSSSGAAMGEVSAEMGAETMTLRWGGSSAQVQCDVYIASQQGVTRHNYQSLPDGGGFLGAVSPLTITGIDPSKTYYVTIYAGDEYISLTIPPAAVAQSAAGGPDSDPSSPAKIDVSSVTAKLGEVTVNWATPPDWNGASPHGDPTASYTIYYNPGGYAGPSSSKVDNVWRGLNSYTVTGLQYGVEYCFAVTQWKQTQGESSMGRQMCAMPQSSNSSGNGLKNVIVIVIDTTRADHLSPYGYSRDTSPHLSDFAARSCFFSRAISASSWTIPSYASMLTSRHAFNHDIHQTIFDTSPYFFPHTMLKGAGYSTLSVQRNVHVYNMAEGLFDGNHYYDTDDSDAVDRAISFIESQGANGKFFIFMGLFNPHTVYNTDNSYFPGYVNDPVYSSESRVALMPDELQVIGAIFYDSLPQEVQALLGWPSMGFYQDSRVYEAAYDGEINTSDYHINRLFSYLKAGGYYDDSFIVVTADHGEHMADHSPYFRHGHSLYNALTHVPLMIKLPNQSTGMVISDHVRGIDVMPTVLDYFSLNPGQVDGKSLLPIIMGTESVDYNTRPVLSYVTNPDVHIVSRIVNNYKLIRHENGNVELYDLAMDPGETNNAASKQPDLVNSMTQSLGGYFTKF